MVKSKNQKLIQNIIVIIIIIFQMFFMAQFFVYVSYLNGYEGFSMLKLYRLFCKINLEKILGF